MTTLPTAMPTLRVMPMPSDANMHGDVSGGWIMAQVDIAGSLPAARRANGRFDAARGQALLTGSQAPMETT